MPNAEETQTKLVDTFRKRPTVPHARRFSGDVCCRILKDFLEAEIHPKFRVSEPNSYIWDSPTEFDLLVIRRNARAIKYTHAFQPEDVLCAVEVKAAGMGFGPGRDFLEEDLPKLKARFDAAKGRFPSLALAYFAFEESTPKRPSAIQFLKLTQKAMKPFPVFCMANRRTGELMQGQWQDFVQYVHESCKRRCM